MAISAFAGIMLRMAQQAKVTSEDSSRRVEGSFCLRASNCGVCIEQEDKDCDYHRVDNHGYSDSICMDMGDEFSRVENFDFCEYGSSVCCGLHRPGDYRHRGKRGGRGREGGINKRAKRIKEEIERRGENLTYDMML